MATSESSKKVRMDCKEAGLCQRCRKPVTLPRRINCDQCCVERAEYNKQRRAELAAGHTCSRCRKQPAREGRKTCASCGTFDAKRVGGQFLALVAQGLCGHCGKAPVTAEGKRHCTPCWEKVSAQMRQRGVRLRVIADRDNLCVACFKNPRTDDRRRCESCLLKAKVRAHEKYGLTFEQLEAMAPVCQICGKEDRIYAMAIDHDHQDLVIRGLLCMPCNTGLGSFRDSPELLEKAIHYLKTRKPSLMSVVVKAATESALTKN